MKNYFFSNLSALNTDLNTAIEAAESLSGYAKVDDISALSSDFTQLSATIGDIDSILDSINGQTV